MPRAQLSPIPKGISKHLLAPVESPRGTAGSGQNLCPGFIPLAPVPPFSAHQHRLELEKGFLQTYQGRQGQKLIRTIHKPGWRSAASHP